ncbi:hypothetical protein TCAL_09044 [Tigriopus californicus]|uniref:Uncharacterized protein n=1 Tax=Tigriopus californicus TaxID=6832 RepID=A0A553PN78_TIGCA|nr:hypothetical protein TCAL_09044 [Tigriopus californicus]
MDEVMTDPGPVVPFNDLKTEPDPILTYQNKYDDPAHVIVLDNGSYQCRVGWDDGEHPALIYKNIMARTRKEKGKESELWVANDILNIEAVRFNLKTPFDRNVVTQYETQEVLLDYAFHHLGIQSAEGVAHPILMTEPVGNPNKCREMMNELLFECYNIPQIAYGVDSLFSFHKNAQTRGWPETALMIGGGFHTIHFIPLIKGQISWSGISRSEEILQNQCHLVNEYLPELRKWSDPNYYEQNVRRMQLPFVPNARPPPVDPEVLKARRQELAKRLVEMNQKKRSEKLQADLILMKSLKTAKTLHEQGYDEKVRQILARFEISVKNPKTDLDQIMEGVKVRIDKARAALTKKPEVEKEEPEVKKRRENMNETERNEFDHWMNTIKEQRENLIEKRAARKHKKDQLAKRRTAASQERMRIISQLAKHSKKDDDFGVNDDDWDDAGDSDSEEEQEKLLEYENVLKENDPDFVLDGDNEVSHDSKEWYQLHIATERIRIPEVLFQPSIIGHDQAGISETLEFILTKYDAQTQSELVANVFLTGSLMQIPGFKSRLETDLREMRPFQSAFEVRVADHPAFDAWTGAAKFVQDHKKSGTMDQVFMSKAEYQENGTEYFKCHSCSNAFTKTPDEIFAEQPTYNVIVGLRGVAAFSDDVAWASGSSGTVLRTVNGGDTWEKLPSPPGAENADFRDIEVGPDGESAIVMAAGNPAVFYLFRDSKWEQIFYQNTSGTFFDAFDFWTNPSEDYQHNGFAFGDPVNGKLQFLTSKQFGGEWEKWDVNVDVGPDIGGFAASGTCLRTVDPDSVFIGLGNSKALILASHDRGTTWTLVETGIQHGTDRSGVFSMDFLDPLHGIAVGGDFNGALFTTEENAAITEDGGITWDLLDPEINPRGYRSSVAYVGKNLVIACGKEGCDNANASDYVFKPMIGEGYYSVSASPSGNTAYASGPDGRLARLSLA